MKLKGLLWIVIILSVCQVILAQNRLAQRQTNERLLCILPMTGAGTYEDPRRPMYAPTGPLHVPEMALLDGAQPESNETQPLRKGILGFSYVISDDGQFALAEFVAADRAAFKEILRDPNVKSFIVGKTSRTNIETEFRKYKAGVNLDRLGEGLK